MAKLFSWQHNAIASACIFTIVVGSCVLTQATTTDKLTLVTINDVSVVSHEDNMCTDDIFALQTVADGDYKIQKEKERLEEEARKTEAKRIAQTNGESLKGRFRLSTSEDSDEVVVSKINNFFSGYPLASYGETFLKVGKDNNIDPYFLAAIASEESGRGTSGLARENNNLFGRKGKGGWASWGSKEAGIIDEGKYLAQYYLDCGLTSIDSIGRKYCEGGAWAGKIRNHINNIKRS